MPEKNCEVWGYLGMKRRNFMNCNLQKTLHVRHVHHFKSLISHVTRCQLFFMTPCRTEKVDFSKNKKKTETKTESPKKQIDWKNHQKKQKNKKKNKQTIKTCIFRVFFFVLFCFFCFFSCFFFGFGFLVCFFCLIWFCFFCFVIFFVKPYILCVVGLISYSTIFHPWLTMTVSSPWLHRVTGRNSRLAPRRCTTSSLCWASMRALSKAKVPPPVTVGDRCPHNE